MEVLTGSPFSFRRENRCDTISRTPLVDSSHASLILGFFSMAIQMSFIEEQFFSTSVKN